jgi:putative Mn2+ efflux pump MntP
MGSLVSVTTGLEAVVFGCCSLFLVAVYGGTIGEHRFREIVGEQWFRPGRGFRPNKTGNFTDS